jgi:hypothetical protein
MSFGTAAPISNTPPTMDFGLIPQPTPSRLQDVLDQTTFFQNHEFNSHQDHTSELTGSASLESRGRSRILRRSWEVEKTTSIRSRSLPPESLSLISPDGSSTRSRSVSPSPDGSPTRSRSASPSPDGSPTRSRSPSPSPDGSPTRSRSPSPSPDGSPTRSRSASPLPNPMLLDDPTPKTNPPATSSSNPQENVPPNRVPNNAPGDPTAVNIPVNPLDAAEKKKNEEIARRDRKALIGAVCSAALIAFSVIAIALSIASLMTATWIWFAISITGAAGSGVGGAFLAHKSCFVSPTT